MRRNTSCGVFLVLALFILALGVVSPANARSHGAHGTDERMGNVNVPTSCSPQVQPVLERGLALLHSFQYQESAQAFGDAADRDSQCAMANWGRAVALYHQLWDFPTAATLAEGRKDITQAEKSSSQTPRARTLKGWPRS
jgi:hypothetical protein